MTTSPTISAIVTFHREGPIAGQTLRGMERVRRYAERCGIRVEFVAVLDCADAETVAVVGSCSVMRADDIILEVANRDLGASRNSGIAVARGDYIGIFDGDDYYSDNWLSEALQVAQGAPRQRIVHPELQVSFGATHCIGRLLDMEERPDYPLQNCLAVHPWIACSFAHRSIYEASPYTRSDTCETGFGFEDWQWNLEAVAAGGRHVNALGTAHFYRRKPSSMLTDMVASGAVIRPSRFFDQPTRWGLRMRTQALPAAPTSPGDGGTELVPAWVVEGFERLASIEPELTPTREFLAAYFPYTPPFDLAPGELYCKAHALAAGAAADVVCIVPWLDCANPAQAAWQAAFAERVAGRKVLVISTAADDARLNRAVPASFSLLEFGHLAREFSEDAKLKALTRLLLQSRASELYVLHAGLGWNIVRQHGRSLLAVGQRIYASVDVPSGRPGGMPACCNGEVTQWVREAGAGNAQAQAQIEQWEQLARQGERAAAAPSLSVATLSSVLANAAGQRRSPRLLVQSVRRAIARRLARRRAHAADQAAISSST